MAQAEGVAKFIRDAAVAGACDRAPDVELVRRFVVGGDEQAFRALVSRYGPVVWSVCRRLTRGHHDAEDAFQATFLVLARKAGGLQGGAAVGGWLYAVAYRVASRVRSARRAEPTEAEPADGSPGGALDELTVREAETALHEELARLPAQYRDPLVLCCLEGLSRDEAAARLGWPTNRVKHGLEQGRERLRARLTRRGLALGVPLLTGLLAAPASAVPPPLTEAAARHATGVAPPAAISTLANGVTRTMWLSNWKWAVAGCVMLALAGGTFAALTQDAPAVPPVAPVLPPGLQPNAEFVAARAPVPKPKPKVQRAAWEVATDYLRLIVAGNTEEAAKLCDERGAKQVQDVKDSGLERVKLAVILMNDLRAKVFTAREPLKRQFAVGQPYVDEHYFVTLERKDITGAWRVIGGDRVDEPLAWGPMTPDGPESNHFLLGGYDLLDDAEKDAKPAPEPAAPWSTATDFLKLALAEKDADALKLVVPGTISENKLKELRDAGAISTKNGRGTRPVAILINDTRMEVVFELWDIPDTGKKLHRHPVIMLTKSKAGVWQVKDIDLRDTKGIQSRAELYLSGRYDDPPAKK